MAKTMQDNAEGKIAGFKSKLEHLGIQISEHLLPAFSGVIEFASNMLDRFANLSPETQKVIVGFGLVAAGAPILITGIGGVVKSVGALSSAFTFLSANPIVLVVGAIAGIVLGIMHLWKTKEGFRDAVHNIWQGIVESVEDRKSVV